MGNSADDDRFGITGRWTLTNAANDFSGNITVSVGMLEFTNLKTGVETTSSMGDLSATRTITLGSNNFNGRRYDIFGNTDQLSDQGFSQGTNTTAPVGDVGTIIFNDAGSGTATFGTNISWSFVNTTTTNTTGAQLINNGNKRIVINGTFATNTTGTHNLVLDGSNTLSNDLHSNLANPATSQTTSVIKEGSGTWRLSGTNTFTGAAIINNGTLELAGGAAIADSATVALNADGGDGFFSGTARVRFINSETIGLLTGDIFTEAEILSGQTLTIAAGNSTMNGLITGDGNLSRLILSGSTAGTLTSSASNTYTGITTIGATGAATANAGMTIYQIADGGVASGLGKSSNAASNLVFATTTAGTNGGTLIWAGFTNQRTDRLFTIGLGAAGAAIAASVTVVGTT
ncbi:MAG: autotransporter-associated beta strand repeat-containing protein, partial [Verrucomicrobiales bacterium]|nr:autotransporter-associated beta strand repeat-containing protein [Verrucomicrobiales bacterium]